MQIELLLFGIIADLIGKSSIKYNITENTSVKKFREKLVVSYPQLSGYNTYVIAINEAYGQEDDLIHENDTVALIPPVSGG